VRKSEKDTEKERQKEKERQRDRKRERDRQPDRQTDRKTLIRRTSITWRTPEHKLGCLLICPVELLQVADDLEGRLPDEEGVLAQQLVSLLQVLGEEGRVGPQLLDGRLRYLKSKIL
jgi:hypothetical protein